MDNSGLGRSARFYQNPVLRDEEWNRAKQPPWWLMVLALAIVVVAFFVGAYGPAPWNAIGWIVGVITIAVYVVILSVRRRRAQHRLRVEHGQTPP